MRWTWSRFYRRWCLYRPVLKPSSTDTSNIARRGKQDYVQSEYHSSKHPKAPNLFIYKETVNRLYICIYREVMMQRWEHKKHIRSRYIDGHIERQTQFIIIGIARYFICFVYVDWGWTFIHVYIKKMIFKAEIPFINAYQNHILSSNMFLQVI